MAQFEIEDLGIKYREEVELEDTDHPYYANCNDIYKFLKNQEEEWRTPIKENKLLDHKKG